MMSAYLSEQQAADTGFRKYEHSYVSAIRILPSADFREDINLPLKLVVQSMTNVQFHGSPSRVCWLCDAQHLVRALQAHMKTSKAIFELVQAIAETLEGPIILFKSQQTAIVFAPETLPKRVSLKGSQPNREVTENEHRDVVFRLFCRTLRSELTHSDDLIEATSISLNRSRSWAILVQFLIRNKRSARMATQALLQSKNTQGCLSCEGN